MNYLADNPKRRIPWNKGKLIGQKPPLKLGEVWAIRIRLQAANRIRDSALFNLTIDSKLRSCDLVRLRVRDITHGTRVANRAIVMQQKTRQPVQFEISVTDVPPDEEPESSSTARTQQIGEYSALSRHRG